jgi:hypothetical protein
MNKNKQKWDYYIKVYTPPERRAGKKMRCWNENLQDDVERNPFASVPVENTVGDKK